MLGWHLSAYRFGDEELRSARCDPASMLRLVGAISGVAEVPRAGGGDHRLAVWQAWLGGTGWLDALVVAGAAASTRRSGYPDSYLLRFEKLRQRLDAGLLNPRLRWRSGADDTFLPGYLGADTAFPEVIADTDPNEWIFVVAWDES